MYDFGSRFVTLSFFPCVIPSFFGLLVKEKDRGKEDKPAAVAENKSQASSFPLAPSICLSSLQTAGPRKTPFQTAATPAQLPLPFYSFLRLIGLDQICHSLNDTVQYSKYIPISTCTLWGTPFFRLLLLYFYIWTNGHH